MMSPPDEREKILPCKGGLGDVATMSSWGSCLKRESMERCGMSWDLFGMETERETEEVGTDTREG